jgi:hypothetical protein
VRSGRSAAGAINIGIGDAIGCAPKIGLQVTPEEVRATLKRNDRLLEVGPQSLVLHFDPGAGHGAEALASLASIAEATKAERAGMRRSGVSDLFKEPAATARQCTEAGLRLDAIAVSPVVDRLSTPPGSAWPKCTPLEEVYAAARSAFPGVRLGGGSFSYFTELN